MILGKGAKSMNKLKIAFMTIVGVFLVGVGAVLGYQPETPVQMQKNFIACLEENLMNTNHDCFTRLTRR
jgi:hypothetical protein